jgi:O-antigen biosynthesis protein WbqP
MIYRHYIKRFLDISLSALAILVLSWLFIILAIIIKCTSKGPIFFKQKRVGKDKSYFYIFKFRTMRTDTPKDVPTHLLTNPEKYITPIGRFLRKTSLDELPQLFNILIGDMAIVGPRPALWNQDDLIAERDQYGANAVRPGLTGLAQVSGRDELPIPIKARYDGKYVDNISLMKDAMLIVKTVGSVLKRDGVKEGGTGEAKKQAEDNVVKDIVIQEYAAAFDSSEKLKKEE